MYSSATSTACIMLTLTFLHRITPTSPIDTNIVNLVTFTILHGITPISPVDITIVNLVIDEGINPYHFGWSASAIDIGLEKLQDLLGPEVNVRLIRKVYPTPCSRNNVGAILAELYYQYNVTALIGPGCSPAVDVAGRMAASWNIPIFSPVATDGDLANKDEFSTLTRLSYNMNKWSQIYFALFRKYGWTDIAIIYDTSYIFFEIVGTSLMKEFRQEGYSVFAQSYDSRHTYDMATMLKRASERYRILVLACYADDLRTTMLLAQTRDMTSGDYAFIYIRRFEGDGVGDKSWYRGDDLDLLAKKAYEALLITQTRRPTTDSFLEFEQRVKLKATTDYSFTYGAAEVNIFVTAFHDAFVVYGHALNESLCHGENYTDGRFMSRKIWGNTFQGIGGDVAIDEFGDREMDFSLLDLDPYTGKYHVVADYFGHRQVLVESKRWAIHWPNGKGAPLNEPYCGFKGDNPRCQQSDVATGTLVASILSALVILGAIAGLVIYRLYIWESQLQNQRWRVRWKDVETISGLGSRVSSKSSVNLGSRRDAYIPPNMAYYKGLTVVIKSFNIESVKVDRKLLTELKQLRDIPCQNLTRFHGLCVEEGHICILREHCSRGNLQDMLHNDGIKLDKEFKISLMNDIISGMGYLHSSPIGAHGRLNSTNCLIDGRFVLKISDFGLPSLKIQEKIAKNVNKYLLLYVAPEHLDKNPYKTISMAGDVYSFAIVLFELLTRSTPYDDELRQYSFLTLLDNIKCLDSQLRPRIPHDNVDKHIVKMIQDCWSHYEADRPTFNALRRRSKELFRHAAGRNILDTLLQRMEQYANNLEGLVEERTQAFLDEQRKSEELLLEILPRSVADRLKNGQSVDPESYQSVTIYFSDIVGFTNISATSTPMQVIDLLNDLYTCFDKILENFDVYKVETIGDAYMVVSGLPVRNGNEHVRQIARMSLAILKSLQEFEIRHMPGTSLEARIGLHTGSVCAGVVGRKMPRYCLFGDTVNTASRMESTGEAMKVHVSAQTDKALLHYGNFVTMERGDTDVKGKGSMKTYWLLGETESADS